jgi:hypothetical protein
MQAQGKRGAVQQVGCTLAAAAAAAVLLLVVVVVVVVQVQLQLGTSRCRGGLVVRGGRQRGAGGTSSALRLPVRSIIMGGRRRTTVTMAPQPEAGRRLVREGGGGARCLCHWQQHRAQLPAVPRGGAEVAWALPVATGSPPTRCLRAPLGVPSFPRPLPIFQPLQGATAFLARAPPSSPSQGQRGPPLWQSPAAAARPAVAGSPKRRAEYHFGRRHAAQ